MIKLLIVLLTVSTIQLDFNEVEEKISNVKKYSELVNLIETEIAYADKDGLGIYLSIERDLGNNTQQIRIEFSTEEYGEYFNLSLVKKEDKLMYCKLSQRKNESEIVFDEEEIKGYLDYFNSAIKTSKNVEDFKSEIDQIWMFSTGCGFGGTPTKEWTEIEKYVKNKNIKKIRTYLYSLDVESQAYGIIGMNKLSENGFDLSVKDKKAIDFFRERNSEVYTCMGCVVGNIIETDELVGYWDN